MASKQTTHVQTKLRLYPGLEITALIYRIFAWVVGILGLIGAGLLGITFLLALPDSDMPGFFTIVMYFIFTELAIVGGSFLWVVSLLAAAELIKLAVNVEHNTHIAADASRKAAETASNVKNVR
ncbi:hypothetical protein LCGC14_2165320 [marine sediment metagenome]|uniref:Uncharacterized protein n=1 Tax=marine sediment metagenome TaxID=412755 RepID=A0A0F9G4C4_9ZZZZ